jgi:hypothetical protein
VLPVFVPKACELNLAVILPPSGSVTVAQNWREFVQELLGGETKVGVLGGWGQTEAVPEEALL